MNLWGVAIPGLAMRSIELPAIEGLLRLENPEVGDGMVLAAQYTLEDIAEIHLKKIRELRITTGDPLLVIGMSMGGMVASILASKFRKELPVNTQFRFLVTSPNLSEIPAVPDALLADWMTVRSGSIRDFERILAPFFSKYFRKQYPNISKQYYESRALGENRQSARAFMRQLTALRHFDGRSSFSAIDPHEATFIGGADDQILGPEHNRALLELVPRATHKEIVELGHMINLEQPKFFVNPRGVTW